MQAGRVGEPPGLLFPRPSRGCALSLFYASITPAPPLALLHSARTYSDLVASACTPRPSTASPSLPCLLRLCWHSPVVGLPLLTGHTAHTFPPRPLGPLPQPQLVPSSLAPAGHQPIARLVLSIPSSPFPSCLVPAVKCDHWHPPPPQKRH